MLASWIEILPLFIVKWLARRLCERVPLQYEAGVTRDLCIARPDVLIKVKNETPAE